ncbi:hypothetical protein VVD49_06315 [Uliginosibacterium sp. H3]|uniref:STAS/SEC14 domain-containing protein n=1 Tax=Uliginosibacterium silvisoli TaxID=3114758 RepID=A0ABU6K066_9RHOO|nr:hypothetical protein [Uliginosibacterium sp. H3]
MNGDPHGTIELQRYGELIVVRLRGSFNLEGARRVTREVQAFWRACGEPARWPVLGDHREWEGATPESFSEAAHIVHWMEAHGLAAEARVFCGNFMPRVLEQQKDMKLTTLPAENFLSINEACDWLEGLGFDCGDCRERLGVVEFRAQSGIKISG